MVAKKFKVVLGSDAGNLFFEVPFDVKKEFGRARPPVKVSINGYEYRSTVADYGGKYYLGVRQERREAAGIKGGDAVDVTLALDTGVRRITPPPELAAALKKKPEAKAKWERLSYTHQKEHADAIRQAKKPETRERRLQKTLEMLAGKKR
jgi:regulator of protease activity HflC (stomatin/prohibitin superfamily)